MLPWVVRTLQGTPGACLLLGRTGTLESLGSLIARKIQPLLALLHSRTPQAGCTSKLPHKQRCPYLP